MALLGSGGSNRTWILKIVADIDDAKKSIGNIEESTSRMQTTMGRVGKAVAAGFAADAVIDFARSTIDAASDVQQSTGAVESVFKSMSGEITTFAQTTAKDLGISRAEFQQLSAEMGAMLKNAGVPMEDLAGQTIDLTQRAADMAATFGTTVPEAMGAISSALRGERDPIEKYGVSLKQTDVDARAAAMGYVDAEGKVTALGKSMATTALIMEQTRDIAGQNAREADTWAGQQQRLTAQFTDMKAELGAKLLPIMVKFFEIARPIVQFIADNIDWLAPLAGILAGIAAAMWLVNVALLANPIVLIVGAILVAIAALIALIYVLITKWDEIYAAVDRAMGKAHEVIMGWLDWFKNAWNQVWEWIKYPFERAWEFLQYIVTQYINLWKGYLNSLRWIFSQVWDIITWPFRHAWDSIKYVVDLLKNAFSDFLGSLRYVFGQIYDVITYPFRRAVDAIKWLWNSTIGGFGFTVPSWIPLIGGKDFRIPEMAAGGIVTRPTVALIGEAGPEAVIPLSRMGTAAGATYNVNVYALNANAETGRMIAEALREYNRTSGRAAGALS